MRRIRLIVEYDGTNYAGWQIQPNGPTIQEKLEAAVLRLTGETVRVHGAGRTDAGVHAQGQVAAFDTASAIPADRFAAALNSRLPDDIAVRAAAEAAPEFDPRRDAKRKLYRYTISVAPTRPALDRRFVWHVKWPLDADAMARAATQFAGTHDFTTFANQERSASGLDNVRTLDRSEILVRGDRVIYEAEGRSFLYNMVRTLAGTLVDMGTGRFRPEEIPAMFDAKRRARAGQGAPPQGLCLVWIRYDE